MKRVIVVPVLVIATLILTSSTSGAISNKAAGKQYLKDVASANAALKTIIIGTRRLVKRILFTLFKPPNFSRLRLLLFFIIKVNALGIAVV